MKPITRLFALLVLVSLFTVSETMGQMTPAQEHAFVKLKELGFVRQYAVDSGDMVEQAAEGNVEAVNLFLAFGVDPDVRDTWGRQALLVAAEQGHADVVAALVAAGADVGVRDRAGRTPLVVAVWRERDDVVDVLLEK